ncbi:MAG: thiamine pyrophosphate-binding protein [Desulfobacterales bacterium]
MAWVSRDEENATSVQPVERHISAVFADILEDAGIRFVFGMPGGSTPFMFDGLVDRTGTIRTVLVRHEGGAAMMADMHARITGKPAVVMGQGPWIGTSGGIGIIESLFSGLPMVIVCDTSDYFSLPQHGPYQGGTGDYGSFDLVSIMRSMTKYATVAGTPSEFIHGLQQAIKHSVTGKPGPAAVLTKWNVAFESVALEHVKPTVYPIGGYLSVSPPCISDDDAEKAAQMLLSADAPVLIAGQGVRSAGAHEEVVTLAEMIGMPVATSYLGKSAVAETHDCAVGTMGSIGRKIANEKIMDSDLILAVGTALSPENTQWLDPSFIDPTRRKMIQIDIESRNAGWTFPVTLGITSDAKPALKKIVTRLKDRADSTKATQRIEALKAAKRRAKCFDEDIMHSDGVPIAPERVVKAVNRVIGNDDLLVLDAGNNRMFFAHHFQSKKAGQVLAAGGVAAIGYGPAASLSAQMTCPDKRVICPCGDGGLMQHLYVFEMAREMKLPVTWVVMNNSCLGNVMDFQPPGRRIATRYQTVDFVRIAEGFGIAAKRVTKPEDLEDAIATAHNSSEPALVDVITDDAPHFRLMA